ncbi:NAD(P)H-hydrate dehydratase [Pollutibacter soli]|uniref:NAD(P)H-hydrate dehydratase n=1 Tax=Pollutibacter soli TaxID=3034157 RepID=UPI003013FA03
MKIFSAEQIRAWDRFTIANEPISSIDLMERAAIRCVEWLLEHFPRQNDYFIFCGTGNNGGDGLAIGRMLSVKGKRVYYFIINPKNRELSSDCLINLNRIKETAAKGINSEQLPSIPTEAILIDAIFGTGLSKSPEGKIAELINEINALPNKKIAIDLPSGLLADQWSGTDAIIRADFTLSFQSPKLAFMIPENENYTGQTVILDIGLHAGFESSNDSKYSYSDWKSIQPLLKKRKSFSHKGTYGHAALMNGSYGMLGAAILSSRACLHSGVGKLSVFCSENSYPILQVAVPEAVFEIHNTDLWASILDGSEKFQAIGVGSGWGKNDQYTSILGTLFRQQLPIVIDADAINCIADHPGLIREIPSHSAITPHVKEFEKLFGKSENGYARIQLAIEKAKELKIHIILKGYRTLVALPDGRAVFNSTGNPGMATAGTGDVLTGMLTSFLAQGYSFDDACVLAVYVHGMAGDLAAKTLSQEAMTALDLISFISTAILKFDENWLF